MTLNPELIAELKAQHGELMLVDGIEDEVVIQPPTPEIYKRFQTMAAQPAKRDQAVDNLLVDTVVYPNRDGFQALLEKRPAYRDTIVNVVLEAAGLVQSAKAKKL